MTVVVITPPAQMPVSLEEAKLHLRVDFDDDDELITALIGAATKHLDGPDGWLGRALITQTLEYRADEFCEVIRLPYPPLQSVTSVKYLDNDGVTQTLSTGVYRTIGGGASATSIVQVYGQSWPSIRYTDEAVQIRYVAGYGDDPEDIPEPIRQALLLMIGHLYENREAVLVGANAMITPMAVDALASTYRIF